MIEPITLGVVVAALFAKALERAADKTVDKGEGALRRLVDALKKSVGTGDVGSTALARLEDAPDSPSRLRELAEVVDERASAEPELRRELNDLVQEARGAGVDIESIVQTAVGSQNVQIAGLVESEVAIDLGRNATGGGSPPTDQ
jgi:uncharacterized protein (UPF0335 family)